MTADELLRAMREDDARPEGICIRWEWKYLLDGEPVTRAVKTLKRRGLVSFLTFSGGKQAVNLTDEGRKPPRPPRARKPRWPGDLQAKGVV